MNDKLIKRYILKNMNAFHARSIITSWGWKWIDVKYENGDDPQAMVTKLIHQSNNDPTHIVVIVLDEYLNTDYVDVYYKDEKERIVLEKNLTFYSEDELKLFVESNKYPQDIPKLIVKVGLSAVTDPADWKHDYIANFIKSGSQQSKMAAILAATLAARPEYTRTILPALQDTDGTIREYAVEMLGAIEQHTSS